MYSSQRYSLMLKIFAGLMVAHWAEHLVQAYQVYVLGYERHHAGGLLGQVYPWLMHTEWLHFAYAVFTFLGLLLLHRAFDGPARAWWNAAYSVVTVPIVVAMLMYWRKNAPQPARAAAA